MKSGQASREGALYSFLGVGRILKESLSMPRKKFIRTAEYPYHVTGRCINREWFSIPLPEVWGIFSDYLHFISHAYEVRIHSFVLMSNHFHLLISTPKANLDEAMEYLLREVSRHIGRDSGRINQVFGGPYHWTVIKNGVHYSHAYKYVYRNPVQAGMCKRVQDYPFSTLRGLIGIDRLTVPAFDNLGLVQDPFLQLKWLNLAYEEEAREMIRLALRRKEFAFPRDEKTKRQSVLDRKVI
jgi:REP element-mobilizing transposase RayT